ncbi:MAG TPA: hypothetical protein VM533_16835 [Fimbriiglobus sp.]|jgi:hypothetical protein|nr:hypothetical protein [Fimbriiglobus sp.]
MGRGQRSAAWRRWVIGLGLLAFASMGCSPSTLWFLMRGDDKRDPVSPLPCKDGKDVVTVAILSSASPTLGMDPYFTGSERELATLIGQRMAAETKEDRRPIRVIEQSKMEQFKKTPGQDWRTMNPAAIGKKVGADYVIDLTVNSMSIFQPEFGREFYQGRAQLQVVVWDVEKPDAPYQDYFHPSVGEQKSTAALSPAGYRKWFVNEVATEVAHRHIPHVATRKLPPVQ